MNEITRDSGYKSRKFHFSIFAIAVIFIGAVVSNSHPGFAAVYDTMVGGVLGVVSAFLVGNVATKWVGTKAPPTDPPPPAIKTVAKKAATAVIQQPLEQEQPEQ